jgi:hypothetical protein
MRERLSSFQQGVRKGRGPADAEERVEPGFHW